MDGDSKGEKEGSGPDEGQTTEKDARPIAARKGHHHVQGVGARGARRGAVWRARCSRV